VEGHSTVEDRRPRNSYHRFCYVFAAQAASACHWNWTAIGVDFRGGDCGIRVRVNRVRVSVSVSSTVQLPHPFLYQQCFSQGSVVTFRYG